MFIFHCVAILMVYRSFVGKIYAARIGFVSGHNGAAANATHIRSIGCGECGLCTIVIQFIFYGRCVRAGQLSRLFGYGRHTGR